MADYYQQEFDQRLKRIDRKNRRLARGYVASVNADGLIVARPRARVSVPWRGLLFILVVLLGLKAAMFTAMGPADYTGTVERLRAGTVVEQVGAYIMAADPATVWIAEQFQKVDL